MDSVLFMPFVTALSISTSLYHPFSFSTSSLSLQIHSSFARSTAFFTALQCLWNTMKYFLILQPSLLLFNAYEILSSAAECQLMKYYQVSLWNTINLWSTLMKYSQVLQNVSHFQEPVRLLPLVFSNCYLTCWHNTVPQPSPVMLCWHIRIKWLLK